MSDVTKTNEVISVAPAQSRHQRKAEMMEQLKGVSFMKEEAPLKVEDIGAPEAPAAQEPAPAAQEPAPAAQEPAPAAPAAPPTSPEFQNIAAELRDMRRLVLEQKQAPRQEVPTIDETALAAKKAIEERDYEALQRMGISIDEWSQQLLQDQSDPTAAAVRQLNQQVKQLQQQLQSTQTELQKRQEQERKSQEQQLITDTMKDIKAALNSDPELQLLSLAGREQEVYNVMGQYAAWTLQNRGRAEYLPPAQAAKHVLQKEQERLQGLFEHAKQLPQFAKFFVPGTEAQAPQAAPQASAPSVQVTQQQVGGSEPPRELTREERKAAILRQLVASQG